MSRAYQNLALGGADIIPTKEKLIQAKSYMRNWIRQIPKKQPCPEIKYNGGKLLSSSSGALIQLIQRRKDLILAIVKYKLLNFEEVWLILVQIPFTNYFRFREIWILFMYCQGDDFIQQLISGLWSTMVNTYIIGIPSHKSGLKTYILSFKIVKA